MRTFFFELASTIALAIVLPAYAQNKDDLPRLMAEHKAACQKDPKSSESNKLCIAVGNARGGFSTDGIITSCRLKDNWCQTALSR